MLIGAGIWAGIDLGEWTSGRMWLWNAFILLVLVIVALYGLISRHYYPLRDRLDNEDIPSTELKAILANPQPIIGAWIGMVVILDLMMYQPF